MFLNIEVDRDFLRFLWFDDTYDPTRKVVAYWFCHVVFGLNASPLLLIATLRRHISKFKEKTQNLSGK